MIRHFRHIFGLLALLQLVSAIGMACNEEDLDALGGEYFVAKHLKGTNEVLPKTPFSDRLMTSNDVEFLKAELSRLKTHLEEVRKDQEFFSDRELAYIRMRLAKQGAIFTDTETWQHYRNLISQTVQVLTLALNRANGVDYKLKECCESRCPNCRFNFGTVVDHWARRQDAGLIPPAIHEQPKFDLTEEDGKRVLLYHPDAA